MYTGACPVLPEKPRPKSRDPFCRRRRGKGLLSELGFTAPFGRICIFLWKELDPIYDKADAGLGFFGLYKDKMSTISSLKSVEYLAKGLPVISGCVEDIMKYENGKSFFKIFPNDESVIDIKEIVGFYDSVYNNNKDRNSVHREIRNFARQTVDMSVVMKPVINYILGEKDDQ